MSTNGRNARTRATMPFGDRMIEVMTAAAVNAKTSEPPRYSRGLVEWAKANAARSPASATIPAPSNQRLRRAVAVGRSMRTIARSAPMRIGCACVSVP